MTLERLLDMLRGHLAALQSPAWPRPHGPSDGPAFYLDAADTSALIAELTGVRCRLETSASSTAPVVRSNSAAAWSAGKTDRGASQCEAQDS